MDEGKLFADIVLCGKKLSDCELVYKGEHDYTRLYVVKDPDKHSFWAHAVEYHSCPYPIGEYVPESHWENKWLTVDTVFEVVAYYDGVRHLEFNRNGDDMDGYLYYPDLGELINMLTKIREIDLEVCLDLD
jgi:hypothetical protein